MAGANPLPSVKLHHIPKRPLVSPPNVDVSLIRDRRGNVIINPAKKYLRPYWLTTQPNVARIIDFDRTNEIIMPIDNQGPFEILYALVNTVDDNGVDVANNFTIEIFDSYNRRLLSNRPLHADAIAGNAQRPYIFATPLLLYPEVNGKALFVRFQRQDLAVGGALVDPVANPINIRFVLFGRRIYHRESHPTVLRAWNEYCIKRRYVQPFFYTTDTMVRTFTGNVLSLGQLAPPVAVTTSLDEMRITDDADFEIWKMSLGQQNFDQQVTPSVFEFTFRERGTLRPWMSQPVRNDLCLGTGFFPFNLAFPTFLERNFEMEIQTDNPNAEISYLWPVFAGRKIFHDDP